MQYQADSRIQYTESARLLFNVAAHMTLKSLVSLVCRLIARDARIECRTHTDRQTDAQTKYPGCACAPRVNKELRGSGHSIYRPRRHTM